MCRNIRILHHFAPPTTKEEIRAAALQYVRKVSGMNAPPRADAESFDRAVDAIAEQTEQLLSSLNARGAPRTREGEREKAQIRWKRREAQMVPVGVRKQTAE